MLKNILYSLALAVILTPALASLPVKDFGYVRVYLIGKDVQPYSNLKDGRYEIVLKPECMGHPYEQDTATFKQDASDHHTDNKYSDLPYESNDLTIPACLYGGNRYYAQNYIVSVYNIETKESLVNYECLYGNIGSPDEYFVCGYPYGIISHFGNKESFKIGIQ